MLSKVDLDVRESRMALVFIAYIFLLNRFATCVVHFFTFLTLNKV